MRATARPWTHATVAALAAIALVACGAGSPTPPPSPSPFGLPSPSPSPVAPPTQPPTPPPTMPPTGDWPTGWDADFCEAFGQVVIAQELTVDVGRALEEDDRDDALALARELEATSVVATEMLEELPEWEPAQEAVEEITELMDMARRMGRQYGRYIDENRRQSLARARGFAEDMPDVVESIESRLAVLEDEERLRCPSLEFDLETP
jgi:hypothetical protein